MTCKENKIKLFSKGDLVGSLQLVTIDHCISKKSKILWTSKQVLMLVNKEWQILSSAQFRSNATKQAEQFFINNGWSISE